MASCFSFCCCFSISKSNLTYTELEKERHAAPGANNMEDYGDNPLLTVKTLPMGKDVGGQFVGAWAKVISRVPCPITLQVHVCPDTLMSYKRRTIESHNSVDHDDKNDEGGEGRLTVDAKVPLRGSSGHAETSVEKHNTTANNTHVVKIDKLEKLEFEMANDRLSCFRVNANETSWLPVKENESVTVLVGFYNERRRRWEAAKCSTQRGTVVVCSLEVRSGQDPYDEVLSTIFQQAMDEKTHHASNPRAHPRDEVIRSFLNGQGIVQPLSA